MSQILIRAALEARLKAAAPTFPTGWDNTPLKPVPAEPYQIVNLLFATPDNPELSGGYRELGYMQVALMYPLKDGSGPAAVKAKAIRDLFPYALTITNGAVKVTINRTPAILTGTVDGDRWRVPVRIDWHSNFLN